MLRETSCMKNTLILGFENFKNWHTKHELYYANAHTDSEWNKTTKYIHGIRMKRNLLTDYYQSIEMWCQIDNQIHCQELCNSNMRAIEWKKKYNNTKQTNKIKNQKWQQKWNHLIQLPLLTPVTLSRSTFIECTRPNSSNISRNCSSSIDFGTWPTNIFIKSGSGCSQRFVHSPSGEPFRLLLFITLLLLLLLTAGG